MENNYLVKSSSKLEPQKGKELDLLEQVQRRDVMTVRGLELLGSGDRLREVEKRRLQGDLRAPSRARRELQRDISKIM